MSSDKEIIQRLGGPSEVAELLNFDKKKGGVQRVQNWLTRGIPAKIKLDYPHLFLSEHQSQSKGFKPKISG
ncbi:hypothetical protein GCM10007875_16210 [Limnobacter litoralis]|uniref:DUF4224 domain-containing protein n=1 Tax=Limnobacter litoralis TaxID=481366 RepID=A0ABQ5YTC7_9BURK|nr:hypothetical protein GCM10007875_16210 [Limnobacter litoralis]